MEISNNEEVIIKHLREEQENNKQLIYEYKRRIQSSEVLEKEYQEEIDRLNSDVTSMTKKLQIIVEQFEEEKSQLGKKGDEEIQALRKKLCDTELENKVLKNEIELFKKTQCFMVSNETSDEDIEELKEKIVELEQIIDNLNVQLNLSQKQCTDLEDIQKILQSENADLQETINLKREELNEAKELIQDLQDDIMCLKSELDSLRNKPLDEQSRGNSLFAEVNDSRVQLKQKMKRMIVKYNEMAKERETYLKKIDTLSNEKTRLSQLFDTCIKQYTPGNQTEIDTYKATIEGLKELVESYKQEVANQKRTETASKDFKFYETQLKHKEKEIESLRDTLKHHSLNHIVLSRNLSQLGTEMVNWKWKASQFEDQVHLLESKMKKLEEEMQKSPELLCEEIKKSPEFKFHNADEKSECKENKRKTRIFKKEKSPLAGEEKNERSNVFKEITGIENAGTEVNKEFEKEIVIFEPKNELPEAVANNFVDPNQDAVKKSVHFCANTKELSEKVPLSRKGKVVVKPLPFSNYCKKN